jgi:predicted outer membrane repeat protein
MSRVPVQKLLVSMLCAAFMLGLAGGALADSGEPPWVFTQSLQDSIPEYSNRPTPGTAFVSSWKELKQAADSSIALVILTADITCGDGDETIVFTNAVTLRSIIGATRFTINGNGKQCLRIQSETSDVPLEAASLIYCVRFINGNSDDGGGAVFAAGDLLLAQCVFERNRAVRGGALYVQGNLRLESCLLLNNRAEYGGGVYLENGDLLVSNDLEFEYPMPAEIKDNKASCDGGGVYVQNGSANITGGTISGNTAGCSGGGVYAAENAVTDNAGSVAGNTPDDVAQP